PFARSTATVSSLPSGVIEVVAATPAPTTVRLTTVSCVFCQVGSFRSREVAASPPEQAAVPVSTATRRPARAGFALITDISLQTGDGVAAERNHGRACSTVGPPRRSGPPTARGTGRPAGDAGAVIAVPESSAAVAAASCIGCDPSPRAGFPATPTRRIQKVAPRK